MDGIELEKHVVWHEILVHRVSQRNALAIRRDVARDLHVQHAWPKRVCTETVCEIAKAVPETVIGLSALGLKVFDESVGCS